MHLIDLKNNNIMEIETKPNYIILESYYLVNLTDDINEKINEGYKPYGYLIVLDIINQKNAYDYVYIQAMIYNYND